jgi:hypothetical protein
MKSSILAVFVGVVWCASLSMPAFGAVLTSVPMQGAMVMPMLSYNAGEGKLRVEVDSTVPELVPLLVSNPGDSFDPADPWHDALDPSRQGLSFSRRYGFVMNTATDPLPAGTAIWIRKLSGSADLGLYRCHMMSLPKRWEPIFGSDGTTNALYWSGTMFHPCAAAPPGATSLTATFEAYLLNTATGAEVPGSTSEPFVFNWTNVSDGRPTLSLAPKIVVSWPISTTNWVLETADTPTASNWTLVTNAPVTLDGQPAVVLDGSAANRFFRMRVAP